MQSQTEYRAISYSTIIPYLLCVTLLGYIAYFNSAVVVKSYDSVRLTASMMGFSSAAFFFFAGMSLIPLGFFLTEVDPKYIQVVLLLGGAFGLLIIASSFTPFGFTMGRAVCGICFSCSFLTSLKTLIYHCKSISRINLLHLVYLGLIFGTILASFPTEWVLTKLDWRFFLLIIALVTVVFSIIIAIFVPDTVDMKGKPLNVISHIEGLANIIKDKKYRKILVLSSVGFGTFFALQSLWISQWSYEVLGFTRNHGGIILLSSALGLLVGLISHRLFFPIFRWVGVENKRGMLSLYIASIILLILVVFIKKLNIPIVWFFYGYTIQAFTALLSTEIKEQDDLTLTRVYNVLEMGIFFYAFFIQAIIGIIINFWKYSSAEYYPTTSYRVAFSFMILLLIASLFFRFQQPQKSD